MWNGMKSVVLIHPMDSREQQNKKINDWMKDTGRHPVPSPKETREYLRKRGYYDD